jgi:hypothetical protein
MAGVKIDNFSTSDVNLTAIMDTLQATRQGHFRLSLTEMDTTTEPKIAAGSIIDLNGSLVYFDADETIGGTATDGTLYVKLIYSSSTVTAEYTSTAPTFDTSKNGWYGTTTSAGHRYIAKMIKSGTSYTGKMLYDFTHVKYNHEIQTATYTGSWSGAQKTATLTFSGDIQEITTIDINCFGSGSPGVSIESVSFSGDTVSVVMAYAGSTSYALYSIFCVAAI